MAVLPLVELHVSLIALFGEEGYTAAGRAMEGVNGGGGEEGRRKYLGLVKEKKSREAGNWLKGVLEPRGGRYRGDRLDRMERYERMGRY